MGHLPGYKTEAKANGLRGDLPCAMGPLPATDSPEAKQLHVCLLSKQVEILRQKSKKENDWDYAEDKALTAMLLDLPHGKNNNDESQ